MSKVSQITKSALTERISSAITAGCIALTRYGYIGAAKFEHDADFCAIQGRDEYIVCFAGGIRLDYRRRILKSSALGSESRFRKIRDSDASNPIDFPDLDTDHNYDGIDKAGLSTKVDMGDPLHADESRKPTVNTLPWRDHGELDETSNDSPNLRLSEASAKGRIGAVRQFLDKGVDIDEADEEYGTALQAAVAEGHDDIARLLVQSGADTNMLVKGKSPLISASEIGRTSIALALLDAGAEPNLSSPLTNPLLAATVGGHVQIILLRRKGAADIHQSGLTDDRRHYEMSPIQAACAGGHAACVPWLLAAGADVNEGDIMSIGSPLCLAAKGGHMYIVKQLLAAGADVNRECGARALHHGEEVLDGILTSRNSSPLVEASYWEHHDVFQLLLQSGADEDMGLDTEGAAINVAAFKAHRDIVTTLLETMKNKGMQNFERALYSAVKGKSAKIVEDLLTAGADADGGDGDRRRWSPLKTAVAEKALDIVDILLHAGADPNKLDGDANTTLHRAAAYSTEIIVQRLLKGGANAGQRGDRGRTPLHEASLRGRLEVVKILRKTGESSEEYQDEGGETALQLAASKGHSSESYDKATTRLPSTQARREATAHSFWQQGRAIRIQWKPSSTAVPILNDYTAEMKVNYCTAETDITRYTAETKVMLSSALR